MEFKKQHQVDVLYRMFHELDDDGSGNLTKNEFLDCLDDPMFCQRITSLEIELDDLPDVFTICDDGDGVVEAKEFIQGMLAIQGEIQSKDLLATYQTATAVNKTLKKMAAVSLELGVNYGANDRVEQCQHIRERVQDLNEVVDSLMASILQRQVESVSSAASATRPRPNPPAVPTADQLMNPNFRARNFKSVGVRKVGYALKAGTAVEVSVDTQLKALSGEYRIRDSSESESEEPEPIVEEIEEYIPPPPPSTADAATQTKWRRSRGDLFKPMA